MARSFYFINVEVRLITLQRVQNRFTMLLLGLEGSSCKERLGRTWTIFPLSIGG